MRNKQNPEYSSALRLDADGLLKQSASLRASSKTLLGDLSEAREHLVTSLELVEHRLESFVSDLARIHGNERDERTDWRLDVEASATRYRGQKRSGLQQNDRMDPPFAQPDEARA